MRVNTAATFVRIYYHSSRSAVTTLLPILLVHFFYLKKKKIKNQDIQILQKFCCLGYAKSPEKLEDLAPLKNGTCSSSHDDK